MTRAVVIGDIFYDHVCDLSDRPEFGYAAGHGRDIDAFCSIRRAVGGGGVQFAVAAAANGFTKVSVIGKVGYSAASACGTDAEGEAAGRVLSAAGVDALLATDRYAPTGHAVIVYTPGDRRLMMSDAGANATFGVEDIDEAMVHAVADADLLYVSGYALVQPRRRAATLELLRQARRGGAVTALDLVPHDLDTYVDSATLLNGLVADVDWLMAAASTARRLVDAAAVGGDVNAVGGDVNAVGGDVNAVGAAEASRAQLLGRLCGAGRSVALFVHPGRALVQHGRSRVECEFEYTPGGASRGQSARSHAALLARFVR